MTGRRVASAAVVALAIAACDVPVTPAAPGVRLEVGADGAEFGRAMPLTVVRSWPAGTESPAWDEARLAPLVVRAAGVDTATAARRATETRRFDAYLFRSGDVEVPAAGTTVRVRPSVDPARPGDVELPGGALPLRLPAPLRVVLALVALGAVGVALRDLRRRPRRAAAAPPVVLAPSPPSPADTALAALAALDASDAALHVRVADVLRTFVHARFSVAALERTTEELAADAAIPPAVRRDLAALLATTDLVKFAEAPAGDAARRALLSGAAEFVRGGSAP